MPWPRPRFWPSWTYAGRPPIGPRADRPRVPRRRLRTPKADTPAGHVPHRRPLGERRTCRAVATHRSRASRPGLAASRTSTAPNGSRGSARCPARNTRPTTPRPRRSQQPATGSSAEVLDEGTNVLVELVDQAGELLVERVDRLDGIVEDPRLGRHVALHEVVPQGAVHLPH